MSNSTAPNQATSNQVTSNQVTISIAGITEPTILRYFERLNAADFAAASQLFAAEGVMNAPFEPPLVGPEAIAAYLQKEAAGMVLQPEQGITEEVDNNCLQAQVAGKVQTPWFSVNVSWLFILDAQERIISVTVKLLASPQELLNLRR